jgi:FKBP-type peptidyl-prolyl cis-trans isomerase SlyD
MKFYVIRQLIVSCLIFCAPIGSVIIHAESQKEEAITVTSGNKVSIEYTLTLDDKSVVDTNVGSEPLSYIQGSHNIISGLENALEGLKVGDSKHVTIKPEDGYGSVDPQAIMEVGKDQIPQDALKVGSQLQGQNADGQVVHARVIEIKEQTVVIDFNHPLADKTLHFDVKILDIQEAGAE